MTCPASTSAKASLMELKWTSKALSDLVRLYDFLAPVNQPAAAHTVQALATAPASLRVNPRIGEKRGEGENHPSSGVD